LTKGADPFHEIFMSRSVERRHVGPELGDSQGWDMAGEVAGARISEGSTMMRTSFRVALSALFFAGALSLASTGAAQAQSIMKQCGDEWKAAKANNTTNGMKWPEFLKQCRAQKEAAAPAAAPVAAPAPAPLAPAPVYHPKPKSMQAARPTSAGQFASEAEAKARCPGDTVVWVNTKGKSHTYHYSGSRWYGTTKQGAYMCEADAGAAGYHASKSRTEQQKQQP
jgi:plastocyanin